MADIDLKTATPDGSLPSTGFLFGADSQAAAAPSVYTTQAVATALLGSTTLTGATITTSSPVIDAAQTWNAGAVTFTGLKFNATDTASAAGSLLMDLQTGGASRFSVGKGGAITTPLVAHTFGTSATALVVDASNLEFYSRVGNNNSAFFGGYGTYLSSSLSISWSSSSTAAKSGIDTYLTRRAAANLRLGAADAAAPVAQTLSVQSVVAGTTDTAGANLTITGSQGTGTGAGGSIVFQVAPAGTTGTAQNALATALTINSTRKVIVTDGTNVISSISGNTSTTSGISFAGANTYFLYAGNPTALVRFGGLDLSGGSLLWGSSIGGISDVILLRDAANTLALRNGANAQTFRVYNTYTDASNYRRMAVSSSSIVLESAGTGGAANMSIGNDTTSGALIVRTSGSNRWSFDGNGHFVASADNTYDIGASGAMRPRNIYAATSITGPHNMTGTAPASATATGTAGDVRYDADYIYVCTAANTWKRAAIATWP